MEPLRGPWGTLLPRGREAQLRRVDQLVTLPWAGTPSRLPCPAAPPSQVLTFSLFPPGGASFIQCLKFIIIITTKTTKMTANFCYVLVLVWPCAQNFAL